MGMGTAGSPTITVNPAALGFGNQIVNTTSSPMTVAISGTSLTADITVMAPMDFLVSSDGTTYGATATLAQTNGSVSATLYVEFKPQTAQGYVSTVMLTSGAASQTVSVSGVGVLPTPVLNVSPIKLADFGSVVVGNSSASTNSFTVSGQNLQGNVTITPPTGFRIRTGTDVFSNNAVVLSPNNGSIASTTIDVRFTPTAAQQYKDSVSVTTPNGNASVAKYVKVSGPATPAPTTPTVVVNPTALDFGTVTSSGSANTQTFDVSGTNLSGNIVLTPSANTLQFRNASAGGTFSSNSITLVQSNGTVAAQTIEVKLVATVPGAGYSETITATSNTASASVAVTANNSSGKISDISVTNPDNNDFTFATRPTTTSASQSFRVSGTNLLQNLTVAPNGPNAGYFQVSSDNMNFVSSLTFAPVNGNVSQQIVYVRFVPGSNALTVTANIRTSSAPAPINDVSVTGISQPTLRLNRAIPAFPRDVIKGNVTAAATVRLDGFLLGSDVAIRFPADVADLTRNPDKTPEFQFSLDGGATYDTTGIVSPNATTGNFSQNLLVRFAPVRVGNAAQEMQFKNPSFNGGAYFVLASGFGQAMGFSIATQPSVQSTASVTRTPDGSGAAIAFNLNSPPAGTAYGQNRLVIATPTYSTFPTNLFPQDKQNFDPGKADSNGAYEFGKGSAIEASSNTYVVFSGASGAFNVSGLDPNTKYYFYAFEFNNDGVLNAENYLVPNNQPLTPLPVELVSFTAQRSGQQVNLNWVTASEKNSRRFDVERSANGQEFAAILSKAGQGNTSARTSYDAVDRQPLPGLSYYRLKQIDLDGKVAYSPVVSVQSGGAVEMSIYPNPTAGKLTISLPQALAASGPQVRISDLMGRVVQELRLPATGEVDLSALPVGTYLVNVGGQQVRSRVVKY